MKKLTFFAISVLVIFIVACSNPIGDDLIGGEDVIEYTHTEYKGTKGGKTYTLTISHPVARAVVGDRFTLKVVINGVEKIASGRVESIDGTNLVYQPDEKDAPNFTVGLNGSKLAFITGTITFNDGTSVTGPGSFTTTSRGGGGGGGGSTGGDNGGGSSSGGGDNGGGSGGGGDNGGSGGGGDNGGGSGGDNGGGSSGGGDNGGGSGGGDNGGGSSGGDNGGGGDTVTVTVTSVIITQPAPVTKGRTQLFTATVNGTNDPEQTVTWSVSGGFAAGTGISSGGLLTVDVLETAATLTVTAVSTFDRTKSGSATVTINDGINVITPALELSSSVSVSKGSTLVLGLNVANLTAINAQHAINGGTIRYQWYSNSVKSTQGGTPIPGKTGLSYAPSTTTIGDFYYYVVVTNTIADGDETNIVAIVGPVTVTVTAELVGIRVKQIPNKVYLMGEEIRKADLVVENLYSDGYSERTDDYDIIEIYDDIKGYTYTFKAGSSSITVVSKVDVTKKTSFNIIVSDELRNTGLPVLYINTQNRAPIVSRDDYLNMTIKVVSDNPVWNFQKTDFEDRIRGRGQGTWTDNPKKPYRIRFKEETSMFGLTASEDWVLLADYIVPTLLSNTVAFELEQRFDGPLFKSHYVYVDVVLNSQYNGTYILTEHMRPGKGRVEIDKYYDWFVHIDRYFDEEPKFRTEKTEIPVMIKSPDFDTDSTDPRYKFVKDSLNELDEVLTDENFPNNNWQDKIDINSLVDWMLINEILFHTDFYWIDLYNTRQFANVYMYKVAGEKIRMSHVWDFDVSGVSIVAAWFQDYSKTRMMGGWFFERFHKDNDFRDKYKSRWNEKYYEIQSMPAFFDKTADIIRVSASLDNKRWHAGVFKFDVALNIVKDWWNIRVAFLDSEINK